jgi:trimethylamine--corrinoid protein Co-methyltransferase
MEMIAKAPESWTITPRNPDRTITMGGNHLNFGNVSSPPSYWDMKIGRKVSGTREMCQNLLKLTQYFNCIHFAGGYPVEPQDIHPSIRHLDVLYDKLTLTDKAIHDYPMLDGWMRLARRGQGLVVTPFTLAGAMAPVTMAGAVAQSIAEALCAVVLAQIIRPGAPCAIGTFTSNVDMKSGAPAFGTPEYMRATQMTGQLARFYRLPLRASGVCAANVPDGQAMWETSNSLWSAVQAGAHMVYHAAGWLEGGLIASPEKFIMDCEILQQIQRYMDPVLTATGPDEIAVEAIREVGDKGHFFGIQHTQDRYTTAFYAPFLSDWRNYEAWEAAGAVWTPARAHQVFQDIIAGFEAPPMDAGIREELAAFVARRKAEGGAPTDF